MIIEVELTLENLSIPPIKGRPSKTGGLWPGSRLRKSLRTVSTSKPTAMIGHKEMPEPSLCIYFRDERHFGIREIAVFTMLDYANPMSPN